MCCNPCANYRFDPIFPSTPVIPGIPTSLVITNNSGTFTVTANSLFNLGALQTIRGNNISFNNLLNTFTVNASGNYRVNYSFTATANATGTFATQISGLVAATEVHSATAGVPLFVSVSENLNFAAGTTFGIEFSQVFGSPVTSATINNLTVSVEQI